MGHIVRFSFFMRPLTYLQISTPAAAGETPEDRGLFFYVLFKTLSFIIHPYLRPIVSWAPAIAGEKKTVLSVLVPFTK